MSEPQANQHAAGERVVYERCLCREALDHLRDCLGVSPAVREHFTNSRIEFLKAIRAVVGPETYVNLMAQHHPAGRVGGTEYPEINPSVSPSEFEQAAGAFRSAGLSRLDHGPVFVQLF